MEWSYFHSNYPSKSHLFICLDITVVASSTYLSWLYHNFEQHVLKNWIMSFKNDSLANWFPNPINFGMLLPMYNKQKLCHMRIGFTSNGFVEILMTYDMFCQHPYTNDCIYVKPHLVRGPTFYHYCSVSGTSVSFLVAPVFRYSGQA